MNSSEPEPIEPMVTPTQSSSKDLNFEALIEEGLAAETKRDQRWDAAVHRKVQTVESAEVLRRRHILDSLREYIRFRLVGFTTKGEKIPWENDLQNVLALENQIVLKPEKLQEDLAGARKIASESILKCHHQGDYDPDLDASLREFCSGTYFEKYGGHINSVPEETLYRVRREGWIILAGLQKNLASPFLTVGYNFGLDSMPKSDGEYPMLTAETLSRSEMDAETFRDPQKISVNWRTGVLRNMKASVLQELGLPMDVGALQDSEGNISLRRLGIGTGLKYIITRLAHFRRKHRMIFNIGTISDYHDSRIKLRNAPSFYHNSRIFDEDYGYRSPSTEIMTKHPKGVRNHIARVHWRARGGPLNEAIAKLIQGEAVLITKGWDIDRLERSSERIHSQIRDEQVKGEHA